MLYEGLGQRTTAMSTVQRIGQADLHGRDYGLAPRFLQPTHSQRSIRVERACIDEFVSENNKRFCKLYKLSDRSQSLLISKQQEEPKDNSPSRPFFNNPSLGARFILNSVFRGRGKLASGLGADVFTCWVASPSTRGRKALAFSSGHSFANNMNLSYYDDVPYDFGDFNFSEVTGCFGSDVGNSEFDSLGFTCSTKPFAIANDSEDFALFEISEEVRQFLLPCSANEECGSNQTFMATFSYPCAHSFLTEAYDELLEKKFNYGIKDMYAFLQMEDRALFDHLQDILKAFPDGTLVCSPGNMEIADGPNCYYKCSTVGGSSGAPVVLTHLPGYVVGIHDGGICNGDYNVSTSTDSKAFVKCYAKYVLPRLPSKDSLFWAEWDLSPFDRWLQRHGLIWGSDMVKITQLEEDELDLVTSPPASHRRSISF